METTVGDRPLSDPSDAPLPAEAPPAAAGMAGDAVSRAAHAAIRRAKARRDPEVTPDDLLIALLAEISRFGIAQVGPWSIDVDGLDGQATVDPVEAASDGGAAGPRYASSTVALFERATGIARRDGSGTTRLVHLLVAFSDEEGLMAELREAHGFTSTEWRAALAAMDPALDPAHPRQSATAGARVPELLSVDDAADFLDVHAQTVRNYIRSGKLPAYRLAGERFIRVLRRDLLALLERVPVDDAQPADLPG